MRQNVLILCWLTFLVGCTYAQDCYYSSTLSPGETVYIYNGDYPNYYRGQQSCKWLLESSNKLNLSCNFDMPNSVDCSGDNVIIQDTPTSKRKYCGYGTVNYVADSGVIEVTLTAPSTTPGGRFLCEVSSIVSPDQQEGCRCGARNPTRIVGGVDAGVNEFPMMAALVSLRSRQPFCGATIIDKRYVLTAAHCTYNLDASDIAVLVGDHDYTTSNDTAFSRLYRVSDVIKHPNFDLTTRINDIAVVRTATDMQFNAAVGPACLPILHAPDTFGNDYVEVLGWGSFGFGDAPLEVLQKVKLAVITNLECKKTYPDVNDDELCTYGDNKDACTMDSGGPALWQSPYKGNLVLIGIIGHGKGCGAGTVNTRVGAYIDWIQNVTPDASYCVLE